MNWFGYQVSGATIGIIGMGRIGLQIAKRAHGFDMKVFYHNRRVKEGVSGHAGLTQPLFQLFR